MRRPRHNAECGMALTRQQPRDKRDRCGARKSFHLRVCTKKLHSLSFKPCLPLVLYSIFQLASHLQHKMAQNRPVAGANVAAAANAAGGARAALNARPSIMPEACTGQGDWLVYLKYFNLCATVLDFACNHRHSRQSTYYILRLTITGRNCLTGFAV